MLYTRRYAASGGPYLGPKPKGTTMSELATTIAAAAPEGAVTTVATVTAYGARNMLNAALKEIGVDKVVAGPQVYNYGKSGMIDGIKRTVMTGVKLDAGAVTAWIVRYLTKNHPAEFAAFVEKTAAPQVDEFDPAAVLEQADKENETEDDTNEAADQETVEA